MPLQSAWETDLKQLEATKSSYNTQDLWQKDRDHFIHLWILPKRRTRDHRKSIGETRSPSR